VEDGLALLIEDADVHGSSMKVDSAGVLVLFGVYPPLAGRISLGFLLGLEDGWFRNPILLRLWRRR